MAIPIRVLIVEDEPADAELVLGSLADHGFAPQAERVETEADYLAGLDAAPDVILADYRLPHFSGLRALELLNERRLDIPFIMVSGTISDVEAANLIKAGARDFLLKDRPARLGSAVAQALEGKRARDEQRRLETTLAESEEKFRLTCETASDVVVLLDDSNRIRYANPAIRAVFGYAPDEVGGKHIAMLQPARLRELHQQGVKRFLETGVTTQNWRPVERIALHRDGHEFPVEIVYSHMIVEGKVVFAGFIRDISERKRHELRIARLSRIHAVLSGINSAIVRIRDRQQLFDEACRIAVEHGGFGIAWIGLFDPETLEITPAASAGLEENDSLRSSKLILRGNVPQSRGLIARAVKERRPVFSNDITVEPEVGGERRAEAIRRGYGAVCAMPFLVAGSVVGTLSLFAKEPNFFDDEEMKLLNELASDISFALEHIAGQEKIEKLSRVRAVSSAINAAIIRIRDKQQLFEEACRIAQEHGKFTMSWIGMLDEATQAVLPVAKAGREEGYLERINLTIDPTITTNLALAVEAVARSAPVICNDIATDGRIRPWRAAALERGYRSTVMLPLLVEQRAVGVFALYSPEPGFFDDEEMRLLVELAGDIAFALQTIEKQEKLDYLSYYDPLTGLPNRTLFNDRLEQRVSAARRDTKPFGVVMLDLERFRNINETLGRRGGDDVIRQVGQRLKDALEETDILAHIGGDHFAIATRSGEVSGDVAHILDHILRAACDQPFPVAGNELRIAARAGIAVYPEDGADFEILLRNAEAALKKAKVSGERYLFYQPKMNAAVAQNLLLESKLRQALEKEQFVLHYQPKMDLVQGTVIGLEALIRWNDPETGLVPPMRFIPLLEETGMIHEAGRWAIRKALQDYREWRARGLKPPRIAVNISLIQLRQENFVNVVRDVIGESPAGAHGLDLEITESLIMEDIQGSIEKLSAVRDLGVSIAIDDFGTGYSSLGYLAKLPVNALKIDRSFIITMTKNADSMTIVSTIISLAHALNLKVIAEGVETEEQRNLLKLLKCDQMQGYLFSRPLPAAEVERLFT